MKKTSRISIYLAVCILLVACNQITRPVSTSIPSVVPATSLTATYTMVLEPTASHTPTETARPRVEETNIPDLLKTSFSVQNVEALNNHTMRKITGWNYGFEDYRVAGIVKASYEWLDTNHLLMHPIIGYINAPISYYDTVPAVINLESSTVWLPISDDKWNYRYYLPQWSEKLKLLITAQGNSVFAYSLDGDLINKFQGSLLGVSPSGTKILMKDGTWIDLSTEKKVDLEWDDYSQVQSGHPSWSANEHRVYICCHLYGDASSGEGYWISEDAIPIDGKPVQGYLNTSSGQWIGDNYLLPQQRWADTNPFFSLGFTPLFDPSAKTFRNLLEFVGIPAEFDHEYLNISISPNEDYLWLSRAFYEVGYFVDLKTRKSQTYPSYGEWSANGKFVIIGSEQVLSLPSQELQPLPVSLYSSHDNHFMFGAWHPTKGVRASISSNEQQDQTLFLLDLETLSYREVALPPEFHEDDSGTIQILWSPEGSHIALVTTDGSLWQIAYPTLENLEQLTPPLPAVKDLAWSPDGAYLAFVSDKDIYIVDTIRNP
jgi:hypothetical protein